MDAYWQDRYAIKKGVYQHAKGYERKECGKFW